MGLSARHIKSNGCINPPAPMWINLLCSCLSASKTYFLFHAKYSVKIKWNLFSF